MNSGYPYTHLYALSKLYIYAFTAFSNKHCVMLGHCVFAPQIRSLLPNICGRSVLFERNICLYRHIYMYRKLNEFIYIYMYTH